MTVRFLTSSACLAVVPMICHAETFLTLEQAQRLIFPGEPLVEAHLTLNEWQRAEIESAAAVRVRDRKVSAWRTASGGVFFLDVVSGKHQNITYACGIQPGGQVKQIEVLEYKEAFGHEVRRASWRQQFAGTSAGSNLVNGSGIRNISGATFSCNNITDGVRRLVHTYAVAFAPPASTPSPL
jgi:Na+-translocating ferredoxin:NAD+ oxidoreductase RnfG subunit